MTPLYCDEYLLERLRLLVTDQSTPKKVKVRAQGMFAVWAQDLRGRRECERLVALHKQVPMRVRKPRPQPKYLSNDPRDLEEDYGDEEEERDARRRGETYDRNGKDNDYNNNNNNNDDNDDNDDDRSYGSSSSSLRAPPIPPSSSKPKPVSHTTSHHSQSKKQTVRKINLTTERPKIQKVLAESGSAATNLNNALQLINWEKELSTQNPKATECFNKCRALRKHVLRYIHSIESEEFIGPLIHANDELVGALQEYDKMSRPADYDSDSDGSADSDYEEDDWKVESDRMARMNLKEGGGGGGSSSSGGGHSSKGKSRRPADEDEEDPFGDSHAI